MTTRPEKEGIPMTGEPEVPQGDETYFEDEPTASSQGFDAAVLKRGLDVLPARCPLVFSPGGNTH